MQGNSYRKVEMICLQTTDYFPQQPAEKYGDKNPQTNRELNGGGRKEEMLGLERLVTSDILISDDKYRNLISCLG